LGDSSITEPRRVGPGGTRFLMVCVGIALFVIGFLLTITSLSENGRSLGQSASENSLAGNGLLSHSSSGLVLIAGVSTSLAGVVTATIGPLFPISKNGRRV
jgi:hypothetical protein